MHLLHREALGEGAQQPSLLREEARDRVQRGHLALEQLQRPRDARGDKVGPSDFQHHHGHGGDEGGSAPSIVEQLLARKQAGRQEGSVS